MTHTKLSKETEDTGDGSSSVTGQSRYDDPGRAAPVDVHKRVVAVGAQILAVADFVGLHIVSSRVVENNYKKDGLKTRVVTKNLSLKMQFRLPDKADWIDSDNTIIQDMIDIPLLYKSRE